MIESVDNRPDRLRGRTQNITQDKVRDITEEWIDKCTAESLRSFLRKCLNLHTAFFGEKNYGHLGRTINGDTEVVLMLNIERFLNQHLLHRQPFNGLAKQFFCNFRNIFIGGRKNSTCLSTTANIHLCFEDDMVCNPGLSCGSFTSTVDEFTVRNRDTCIPEDLFCFVFAEFHVLCSLTSSIPMERAFLLFSSVPLGTLSRTACSSAS